MKRLTFNNLAKTAFQLAFIFCIQFSFGQEWTTYSTGTTSKTLANNQINCITIDKNDNKWIGTVDGVSKFDGNNWTSFTKTDGLINNFVTSIVVDKNNNIWFGTQSGVSKFDGINWTSFTKTDGLINNFVTCITTDKEGNLWFGTYEGVSKFDGTNWTSYTTSNGLISNSVTTIAIDNNNNVWFGTWEGISRFDGTNWTSYTENFNLTVKSIAIDKSDNLWFGTWKGISKFDGINWTLYTPTDEFLENGVTSLAIDKNDNIWVGTGKGISKFDGKNWNTYNIENGLNENSVNSLVFDSNDNLWVGTWNMSDLNGGLSEFNGSKWTFYTIENGLVDNYVFSTAVDKNKNLWVGTLKGLSKFDGINWVTYTTENGLIGNRIHSILIDNNNILWVGTNGGVSKFDGTHWTSYTTSDGLISNSINSIVIDKNNNLWFGTWGGISKFDGTNWKSYTTHDGLIDYRVNSMVIDKNDNLWVGTSNGVSKFDGINWKSYTTTDGLINNIVHSIAIDNNANLWVGHFQGLSKFDGTNWSSYSLTQFLALRPITIDKKNILWTGIIGGGFSKFNGTNWTSYTTSDGLISEKVICLNIDQEGNKWIGTENGISKLYDGGSGPVDIFETPKAMVFNDENDNGKKDVNEKGISGQIFQIDSTFSFSQDNGFIYSDLTDGSHTISFKTPENWEFTTDSTFTINIPNNGDTLYFGIKAIENRPDLKVNVTSGRTRSNFSANYWVNYKNAGSVTESGTVEVVLDSAIAFESSAPAATAKDGQKLRFDFTDLGVNESKQIRITAKMPNVEFLGDTLTTLVSISPILSDVDSSNNSDTLRSVLTGSYDPNDKAVQQGVLDENYVLFGEKLNYTIRFQNTGNDTAFNVNVTDTISSNMDVSSFELIGSSHPCQLEVKGTNTMVFHFYDILLPDSNVNEIGSHGYVQYSIKPKKGLAENTKVNNTGYIYFDYNPAIVTNTTLNTYVSKIPKTISTEGLSTISANNLFTLYPNPTESNFTVDLGKETRTVNVKITDIQGRLVKQESKENTRFVHLNLAENKGIFFVTVSTEKGEGTLKVVSRQ